MEDNFIINEDNLKKLYGIAQSKGMPDSYEDLRDYLSQSEDNRKKFYDKMSSLGMPDSYEDYTAYIGRVDVSDVDAAQQPQAPRMDVSDVEAAQQPQAPAIESPENGTEQAGIPTVTMEQLEQQPNSTPAPGSDGHFLGNISVGADGEPKPMEENPLRNPDNQPAEERTIPDIEVQRQKVDEISQALNNATRQRNEQRAQQQMEREEEIGIWGRMAKGLQAAENPITPEVVEVITNPTDNDLRAAQNEVRSAKKQLQLEEMRQNGEMKGLAFIRGLETANYYDLIPAIGMADAMSILAASQAIKEGKELTESQQLLLQAMEARAGVDLSYKGNNTIWERVGQSTPEQLMFTLQFVVGAGLTGATEAGERIAAKQAQKAAIRYAKKGVTNNARRFVGGTVLPKLEGMAVSSTIQTFANPLSIANMAEDFERRYAGDIYYDNDGNLHVFDNDRSAGQAAYQTIASAWIENFTEYSGQNITKSIRLADGKMFDLAGKFDNVMKNVGGGRIKDVFTVPQKLSHLTQIGSAPEEFLEEELGSVMNALFATDAQRGESYGDAFKRTVSQSFSGEQQLETLLSCTITSMLLGGGGNAVNAVGNAGYRREINREVEQSKALLGKVNGIDIAELDAQIENGQISDIASYLKEQSDANGWSQDEQGAAVSYVMNRARQIGVKHHDDTAIEEAQQEMRKQAEDMANRWDGNIYNATWKDNEGNEQPVTIINGRIHYTTRENGTIHFNPYTSSGMIAIRLADGTKKQVPSRTITGIQSVMSVDEQLEAQEQTIPQMMQAQFEQEGMAIPTVESVWGGNLVANETQFENGKYTFLGQDQNGLYAFANNDKRTQKDNPIVYMTERQLVEYGLSLNIQSANATGETEAAQQAQDDLDFMQHLDELTAEATEKDQWDVLKAYASQYVGYDENGSITPESNPKAYAPYLLASSEGSFENAIASIDESIAAWASEVQQQSQAADISGDAEMNAETHANMESIDGKAAGMIDFYTNVRNILLEMQQGQQEAIEESLNEMPVSQMEVGQEFPVMYDGQQAVAVVVGKDADGRNVVTIRDQEGNDLESGIDDWTDEKWESGRIKSEQPQDGTPMESAGEGTEQTELQGLEGYNESDIADLVRQHIESVLEGDDTGVDIVGIKVIGSRANGNANEGSDLDVLVEYKGDATEDGLFNLFNDEENRLYIEGIPVDINPITEGKSGTIEQFMARNAGYQKPIEQKSDEIETNEEAPVSPAQQTFDGLVQKYGDKSGHKIDVTAEDKSKTLDKAKKALDKAQTDYDDAPIGKEEKAEAALQKAQEEYNTALAEKQEWDEVKAVKDRFVAEQLAAQQAADEERHAQAVAEEEARRAEEERKAREREATGANNVAPNIREKWEGAQRVEGNADEITLANGERIAGHYVLVESGAASASHDALNGFAKTEGFPLDENEQSVNDRDYERDQNAQQITRQIAAEYDSRALQQPVVVSQDGVVLSGNGRTMAGEIAAAQNTDGAYIDYLKKYAPKYGFTPEQVEGMAHPRVVFVPDASMPYTAETFAKFNQQEMKGQSKTEQAVKLGKLVDDATFGRIIRSINRFDTLGDFYADTKATAEAIGELLKAGAINQMQHTEMFDGDAISAQGREILENMLIGKAFESNPDAVRQLTAFKSLRQSVITALAEISNNIALGEYSLESELSDAIALAYNARKNGYKAGDAVSEFARQGKLFETEEDATAADYTNATVLMLADVMNDNRVTRLKKVLSIYNQQAEQSAAGQTDLFAEGVKTKQEILDEVLVLLQHGTESEQQQALDAAREQRKAAAEQGTGVQENGDTGEGDAGERGNEQSAGADVGGRQTDLGGSQPRQSGGENTEEVDENGRPFVKAADGSTVFGEIRESSGLQPAPIKLSEGYQDQDGKGYGLVHIEANHGEQIRNEGFETVEDFVSYVAQNYDEDNIRVGKRRENGNTTFLIQVTDEHDNTLFIELSQDGSYWNVNSAGVFRKGYSNKKETVAKTEPQQPNNTVSTDSSLSESEESGIAPSEPNGESTVSDGKNTENSGTESEKQENISETAETPMESAGEGTEQTPPGPLSEGELGPTDEAVAAANEEVDTNPTEAQKEAGNYKKGHVTIDGFDISIENPAGSTRSGTDAQGNPWSVTMHNSYGYIRMTEGVDGDHIDIFLSDHIDDWNGTVYVVDQVNEDGSFDEHKVMYGFNSAEEAREAYLSNYSEGWQGLGTITGVSREEFKKWVDSSHRKTKAFADYKSVQPTGGKTNDGTNGTDNQAEEIPQPHYPSVKKVAEMRKKYPDALFLIHVDDYYQAYGEDAQKLSQILGVKLTEVNGVQMALIHYKDFDTSLRKLVDAKQKVALAEEIVKNKKTKKEEPKKETREELDRRLMEERKQRILAEGTSFDKPFGLVPVSETMTVEDIDTNMQRIAEGLKANEGNKDFGNFYGFAYQGNFKENLGQQLKNYYQSLTGAVDPKTLMAWAGSHGFKTYDDVVEYGKGLYDKTNRTDKTDKETEEEPKKETKKETKKQPKAPGKAGSQKIDDVGEKIAGARKDMRREIAKGIGEATVQSLIELPFSKAFKKPNLKKAVESGALREEDAFFFDAWLASTVNTTKPKVTQQEVRRKRYNPNAETNLERWAKQTFEALDFLRTFVEADETERDRIIGNLTAEVFPKREAQLAEFERIRELNKGRNDNITFGDCLTPNPVWVTYQVMQRLGYTVGDKLDIPFGILRGNTTGTSYYLYNTKDEHSTYIYPNSLEEGIDAIVWLARIKRGDTDIQHPVSAFYTTPTKSEMGDSGRFRVVWGAWSSMKNQEFDSKEAAEAFAAKKKDAYVNPIQEVKRRFGYKIMFRNPLTGERTAVSDMEFDTKAEAEAYMDGNYEAMNDGANEMLAKESGTKKEVTADDVVGVTVTYGKDGWQYAAVINAAYANNMGMPLVLQEFKTRGEAKAYADSVKDKVFETYRQYKAKQKEFVYFGEGEDTRIGEDYRGGKDVTAEDFMNTFGFRGVQFGNWTNQADRQMAVNQAYDAFMDLAKLLGMSPRAMSLNGELGIAFGARGSGNANAHYEYDEVVINLTKTRGAGSLAHEWWHALDNYFARRGGMGRGMVTDVKSIAMRDELRKAYDRLIDEIEKSNYYKRSVKKGDYWGRMHEVTARLLAEWVNRELKQKGELNTFLARGVDTEKFVKMNYELYKMLMDNAGREAMPFEEYKELDEALSGLPYPSDKEIDAFSDALRNIFETIEEREGENGAVELLSIREEEPPVRTGIGYKVFVLKDGKLYPPMVANPNGEATPVGVWLDADAAPIAGESKTGRPQVKAGGKGTQGGSGQLAYRPGWHLGTIPYAIQFNRKDENGEKTLFPKDFVWAEVEYADDVDYQQEAESYGVTENGKYRHSYAGLPRVPKDGSYTYRTNPNPETDPWIITGAMKVKRILTPSEVDAMVREAGREPQRREEGAITDEEVNHLNGKADNAQQIAFNAVMDALGNAGIEVVMATQEDVEKLKASIRSIQDSKGTVRGWVGNDGRIYLTSEGMSAETPIHEYTHLWAEALQMENPELWEQIKDLLKDTPEWKRIASSVGYKHIRRNEDRLAGEVLAHISGKKNAERMEAEAKRMIDEAPTLEEAAKAANLLGRMRDALKKFWTWVGKTLLGKKGNINIDQVSNMVLADLTNGIDPFNPRGGKRTNRTKRTDASVEGEMERIKREAQDNGTFMKAPNGKPTKLTERQWLQVRTEAFKKWFGDWELANKLRMIRNAVVTKINKHNYTDEQLETVYSNLESKGNVFDGRVVDFVNSTYGKIIKHKGVPTSLIIPQLAEIYDAAIPIYFENEEEKEGHKKHPNFVGYHNYLGKIDIDGKQYYVRLTVQEINTNPSKKKAEGFTPYQFHSSYISDIELYEKTAVPIKTPGTYQAIGISGKADAKLQQFFESATEAEKNSSKIVDENGEPMVVYHGGKGEITVFDKNRIGENIDYGTMGSGFYFTSDRENAENYARNAQGEEEPTVVEAFLNIRNAKDVNWNELDGESQKKSVAFTDKAIAKGHDGFTAIAPNKAQWIVAFNPNQIKSATDNNGNFDAGNPDIRFSIDDPESSRMAVRDEFDEISGAHPAEKAKTIRQKYEQLLTDQVNKFRPLKQLEGILSEKKGRKLRDSESFYSRATMTAARTLPQMEAEREIYLLPLEQAVNEVFGILDPDGKRAGRRTRQEEGGRENETMKQLRQRMADYLIAKHGLERNEWFHQQALAKDPNAQEEDKSGLRGLAESLGENPDDYKAVAERVVAEFEQEVGQQGIDNLWKELNGFTNRLLEMSYNDGFTDKDHYEELKGRWKHYVPLRGFAEGTSDDMYYYTTQGGDSAVTMMKAKGRTSKADDPLTHLVRMQEKAVTAGNDNWAKTALYNAAINLPSDLLRVKQVWYTEDPNTGEIIEHYADLSGLTSPDDIDAAIKQFNADMKAAGAKRRLNKADVGKRIRPQNIGEHEIEVWVNGKKFVIEVNGNPSLVRAYSESQDELKGFIKGVQKANRLEARLFTTWNPEFAVKNMMRDTNFALFSAFVIGGTKQWNETRKNIHTARLVLPKLMKDGTVSQTLVKDAADRQKLEQWYREFIENGGETGFTRTMNAEQVSRDINDTLRAMAKGNEDGVTKMEKLAGAIEDLNRWAENSTRFAAYITARERGESVTKAMDAAKNSTLNFNIKGYEGKRLRAWFCFFNARLQGVAQLARLAKQNPKRFAIGLGAAVLTGAMVTFLNILLLGLGGDDDDWKTYEYMSEYTGNNNLVLFIPGIHKFVAIPYSQELAPFSAIGNIWFREAMGWNRNKSAWQQELEMGLAYLPMEINLSDKEGTWPMLGSTVARSVAPTIMQPIVEYAVNENFMNMPLRKDSKYKSELAAWTQAYENRTSGALIKASKWLNGGGSENRWGKAEVLIDPSFIQHVVEGTAGGVGSFIGNARDLFTEPDWFNHLPFVRKFMFDGDPKKWQGGLDRAYSAYAYDFIDERDRRIDAIRYDNQSTLDYARQMWDEHNSTDKAIYDLAKDYRDNLGKYKEKVDGHWVNMSSFGENPYRYKDNGRDPLPIIGLKGMRQYYNDLRANDAEQELIDEWRGRISEYEMQMVEEIEAVYYRDHIQGKKPISESLRRMVDNARGTMEKETEE